MTGVKIQGQNNALVLLEEMLMKKKNIEGYLAYWKNGKIIVKDRPRTAPGQRTKVVGTLSPDGTWDKCELPHDIKSKIEKMLPC